jgi:hypothetical protein
MGIWRDWCSWGWFCPSVCLKTKKQEWKFAKAQRNWTMNFPDAYNVLPSDHYILPVDLLSDDWIRPKGFDIDRDEEYLVSVRFDIEPDEDTKKMNVWTGSLVAETRVHLDTRQQTIR